MIDLYVLDIYSEKRRDVMYEASYKAECTTIYRIQVRPMAPYRNHATIPKQC